MRLELQLRNEVAPKIIETDEMMVEGMFIIFHEDNGDTKTVTMYPIDNVSYLKVEIDDEEDIQELLIGGSDFNTE
jgi:hypothetical protein